jgi:hypothetical protein
MLSHDLAHALLARRNNDVRIEVLVEHAIDVIPGEELVLREPLHLDSVELRDADPAVDDEHRLTADQIVTYDSTADVIVIRAATVLVIDRN